ncbi:hypothetical protein [uncultured Methanomethylovorans sp.]|uniref:hypothetical protein n=1 Tax=uncultured Methanomethylovorans sp. TaxID=183759 RepID=UPI002AA86C0F|nr:hypothetical protein [uncultured Methanomethylovorans sp.]
MRTIQKIAYASVALLVVSMLLVGAVSAKAGEGGNGKMLNNNGDCICDGVCPYTGDCPNDGQCINTGVCVPKDKDNSYLHNYGGNN